MPLHSFGRMRKMVKAHKARLVRHDPLAVRLTYDIENPAVDECLLGIDPGRTNIGLCAVDLKGHVLFASDVETRNKEIVRLMLERKAHRQASRRGERKTRQRRAVAADKTGMAKATEFWRMLPGYEKPVCCKVFKNSNARFNNRKRPDGWLTPTANQLLQTHINLVKKIQKLLPVSGVVVEINSFTFARMDNPDIKNWEFQKGRLFGFDNVEDAIYSEQKGICLLCSKAPISEYHHLVPRSRHGSESIDNRAGLCKKCHELVHKDKAKAAALAEKKQGCLKKYGALSVVNQTIPHLLEQLPGILPTYVTTGYETKLTRDAYGLDKDHYVDAWCIAVSAVHAKGVAAPDFADSIHNIRQYRRHDRQIIHAQRQRTYRLDGKAVCHNRHKAIGQEGSSLEEYRLAHPGDISKLTVTKSTRYYNNVKRMLPGASFIYERRRYVMSGQHCNGSYLRAEGCGTKEFPASKCRITQNTGLVFI